MVDINVNQYGDELLTLYASGDHEAAIDMYTAVQITGCDSDEAMQTLVALHNYELSLIHI